MPLHTNRLGEPVFRTPQSWTLGIGFAEACDGVPPDAEETGELDLTLTQPAKAVAITVEAISWLILSIHFTSVCSFSLPFPFGCVI